MSTTLDKIHKLIGLAGNNSNEPERCAAALKACEMIRNGQVSLTEGQAEPNLSPDHNWNPMDKDNQFVAQQAFYHKIVLMNGTPILFVIKTQNARCSQCGRDMRIGDIATWIPKTSYVFHPVCWAQLKVKVSPY